MRLAKERLVCGGSVSNDNESEGVRGFDDDDDDDINSDIADREKVRGGGWMKGRNLAVLKLQFSLLMFVLL